MKRGVSSVAGLHEELSALPKSCGLRFPYGAACGPIWRDGLEYADLFCIFVGNRLQNRLLNRLLIRLLVRLQNRLQKK